MGDPLVDYLRSCCLQVLGKKPGCGFFIAPHLVVTCAHVVGRDLSVGTAVDLLRWGQPSSSPLTSEIIGLFPQEDIAFLQTTVASTAFAPLSEGVRQGHGLTALGFTKQDDRKIFNQLTATYEGKNPFQTSSGHCGVEIKIKAGQVEPGYSGGPLLNLETGRVLGVMVATRDKKSNLGGWAIPSSVIETLLPESYSPLPSIDSGWTDIEAQQQQENTPGLIQLTPEQVRALVQTPDTAEIERLSQRLGKNQNAIRLALRSLGEQEQQIADEALSAKLLDSVQLFETQLQTLAVLRSDNGDVEAQFTQARAALEADNPDAADISLETATELALARAQDAEALEAQARAARERGLMDAAAALEQRGQLARARFAYQAAARYFGQAVDVCPTTQIFRIAKYRLLQAHALYQHGNEQGDNQALLQAIDHYGECLTTYSRNDNALDWAATQNNLGTALRTLGARESGTERLEGAVAAYQHALLERTRDRVPLDWAVTQNNLGNALRTLGERESGTERLEGAVAAYQHALLERTRDRVPLDWAVTQNNLGNALWTLGARTNNIKRLEIAKELIQDAYDCYREAGYDQYNAYFEDRLATITDAISSL